MIKSIVVLSALLGSLGCWASIPEQKPLEVTGQSRNVNMMLVLRDNKDKIKFVKLRDNYHEEIIGESGYQADPQQIANQAVNPKKAQEK